MKEKKKRTIPPECEAIGEIVDKMLTNRDYEVRVVSNAGRSDVCIESPFVTETFTLFVMVNGFLETLRLFSKSQMWKDTDMPQFLDGLFDEMKNSFLSSMEEDENGEPDHEGNA